MLQICSVSQSVSLACSSLQCWSHPLSLYCVTGCLPAKSSRPDHAHPQHDPYCVMTPPVRYGTIDPWIALGVAVRAQGCCGRLLLWLRGLAFTYTLVLWAGGSVELSCFLRPWFDVMWRTIVGASQEPQTTKMHHLQI
jgi:hypothetical protein